MQQFNGNVGIDGKITTKNADVENRLSGKTAVIRDKLTAANATVTQLDANNAIISEALTAEKVTIAQDLKLNGKNYLDVVRDTFYPIGTLYMSIIVTSPASLFGGTWEKLTGDAYLKIVTSGAGNEGGTSMVHKIPLASTPQHWHHVLNGENLVPIGYNGGSGMRLNYSLDGDTSRGQLNTDKVGGGQAYYPYYYGVYVWRRTA